MQVKSAINTAESKGCNRSGAALDAMPKTRPGLLLPLIPKDFETLFEKALDYKAQGASRLTELIRDHCSDIVKLPSELDQYCTEVRPAPHGLVLQLVPNCSSAGAV